MRFKIGDKIKYIGPFDYPFKRSREECRIIDIGKTGFRISFCRDGRLREWNIYDKMVILGPSEKAKNYKLVNNWIEL